MPVDILLRLIIKSGLCACVCVIYVAVLCVGYVTVLCFRICYIRVEWCVYTLDGHLIAEWYNYVYMLANFDRSNSRNCYT